MNALPSRRGQAAPSAPDRHDLGEPPAARRPWRVSSIPIAMQLGALLGLTLLTAQAIVIAIVVLLPPPPPTVYRLHDVAEALAGRQVASTLMRKVELDAPTVGEQGLFRESRLRVTLAEMLKAPIADVHLFRRDRGRIVTLTRPPAITPRSLSDAFVARPDTAEFFDDFVAAYRNPQGQWMTVQPRPAPFPDPWQQRLILWLLGCLLFIAPAAWWFANRITRPIEDFAEAAHRLRRDPKAAPLPLAGPRELRTAAAAFNEMQTAIQSYVDARTTMFAAISHDLRTPLSRLRFKLEGAGAAREAMLSDVAQMERMITAVLEFARDESQARPGEPLDLRAVLECVVDDAAGSGGDAAVDDGEAAYVHGDVTALRRLFDNLVENALRYGGRARVTTRRHGAQVTVEVRDDGPGLAEAELETVFSPFYRADAARNLDKQNPQGGVGLGLSIARAIARAHGGEVKLANGESGLVARVTLPAHG